MKHIPRFFVADTLGCGQEVTLDTQTSHHITTVLRLTIGEALYAFNNQEGEYEATLIHVHKKQCRIHLQKQIKAPTCPPEIHLFFAPVKSHRTDMILEKGTELGVTHFHPCLFQYSMIRKFNTEKAHQQCIQAAQQCGRLDIPHIEEMDKILSTLPLMQSMQVLLCDQEGKRAQSGHIHQPIALIIGPEGGIHPSEKEAFLKIPHIQSIALAPYILRAETAVIAGLSQIPLLYSNLR